MGRGQGASLMRTANCQSIDGSAVAREETSWGRTRTRVRRTGAASDGAPTAARPPRGRRAGCGLGETLWRGATCGASPRGDATAPRSTCAPAGCSRSAVLAAAARPRGGSNLLSHEAGSGGGGGGGVEAACCTARISTEVALVYDVQEDASRNGPTGLQGILTHSVLWSLNTGHRLW